ACHWLGSHAARARSNLPRIGALAPQRPRPSGCLRTSRPPLQPNCCSACWNAATRACPSRSFAAQHANPPHTLRLLRPRREPPRRRAAEKRYELAPPQVEHATFLPVAVTSSYAQSAALSACHSQASGSLG